MVSGVAQIAASRLYQGSRCLRAPKPHLHVRGKGMETAGMSVLRRVASDPFSRRMLYFSVAYSLYLALPLSWGFSPAENERVNPTYGYAFSGYYGIVTALIGFLSALTCRDRAILPNSIVTKLIVLAFFVYSARFILYFIVSTSYRVVIEPDGHLILDRFHFGIGLVFIVLSSFLLLGALFTSPRTTIRKQ